MAEEKIVLGKSIAQRIDWLMRDQGFTEEALAEVVGCSQNAINKARSGETRNPRNLLGIAEALGVSTDTLHGRTKPDPSELEELSMGQHQRALMILMDKLDDETLGELVKYGQAHLKMKEVVKLSDEFDKE